jgi:hypothetical protein
MKLAFIIPADFFIFLWAISSVVITYFVYKLFLSKLLIKAGVSNTKVQIAISLFLSIVIAFIIVSFMLKLTQ